MWVKNQIYKAQPVTVRSWCNRFQSQNASCQCHVSLCLAKQSAYFMRKKGVLTNKHLAGLKRVSRPAVLSRPRPKSQTKKFGQTEGVMTVFVVTLTLSLAHFFSGPGASAPWLLCTTKHFFHKGFQTGLWIWHSGLGLIHMKQHLGFEVVRPLIEAIIAAVL